MNKFEKCMTCSRYKECDYLKRGDTCSGRNYVVTTNESDSDCIKGKNVDLNLNCYDNDIRLDLIVERKKICKLWGQVKDTYGNCVEGVLVTLLKPKYIRGEIEYSSVLTTISDNMGFYQFEIDKLEKGLTYRVSVSKS